MLLVSIVVPLAAGALAMVACGADGGTSPSPDAAYGESFQIAVGDTKRVGGDGLTLRLEGVPEDSRCPVDVNCIWEGEARVSLHGQAPSAEARTFDVVVRGTGGSGETLYAQRFNVRVEKLEPAPVSTQQIQPSAYKATLIVTRQ